jgi:hypothetical protein
MLLDATTKKIQVKSDAAATTTEPSFIVDYADVTSSGGAPTGFISGSNDGLFAGTTQVDAVAAPGAGIQRRVREMAICNNDTVAHVITISYYNAATLRTIQKFTLSAAQTITYVDGIGWTTAVLARGIPTGGTTGQTLQKLSGTDYDTSWVSPTVPLGLVAQAGHPLANVAAAQTAPASAQNVAIAMPVLLWAPMQLQDVTFRSAGVGGSKTMEWRLYVDVGTALLNEVVGAHCTGYTWTASANSTERAPCDAPPILVPAGAYWLVVRVTGAGSISFGQSTNSFSGNNQNYGGQTKTLTSALGATLDFSTGWTLFPDIPDNFLNGRVFGKTTSWS